MVQFRLSNLALLDINNQPAVRLKKAHVQRLLWLVPLGPHHDAVSVTVRLRARHDRGNHVWREATDALDQIRNLLSFQIQLQWIVHMLVLTAAAGSKIATTWD